MSLVRRKKSPTSDDHEVSERTRKRRAKETYQAALEIHGGSEGCSTPVAVGLIDTLGTKFSKHTVASIICKRVNLAKKITKEFHQGKCRQYESSDENMIRSVAVYYGVGVMGKRKYIKARHSLAFQNITSKWKKSTRLKIADCSVPALVPYYKLVEFINSINVGTLHCVRERLCQDVSDGEKVNGYYRNIIEFLPRLAEFYLNVCSPEELNWFGQPFTFRVAIGGDGAPFGKYDQSCSWLVSFLNVGKRFLSSEGNFLIFGANCSESCVPVQKFVTRLVSDMEYMETNVFKINGIDVKFQFAEIPNDMKMLSFLGGELSNSATFFSSFGSVSYANMSSVEFTFGQGEHNQWKPWTYEGRLQVVAKVQALKHKLAKTKLSESTKRTKVTSLIAQNHSRQEFPPRIGRFITKAHVEPLHLKNNACALMHRQILEFAIEKSNLPQNVTTFQRVSPHSPFAKFVTSLKTEANLSRLAKKIIRWFDETKGNGKHFEYRFTGKDSRGFLHNFMYLLRAVECQNDSESQQFKLHIFAFTCLSLRDAVSLFCRFAIEQEHLNQLDKACSNFFYSCALFLHVNPTVWTLGHVVPVHTREIFTMYGVGLSINSMEGREAKHQAIARYAQNSTFNTRWQQVFRHEFVSLIWLQERGHNSTNTPSSKETYIPNRVSEPNFCYCGMPAANTRCKYCSHNFRSDIAKSVTEKCVQVNKTLL